MIDFLLNASILFLIIFAMTYLWYCVSLALLLARLGAKWWKAFVPIYNISALVDALKLPRKWFYLSIAPYIGSIYAIAIAYRLGELWGKHFAFSAFWLTIAAPVGFLMLAFSKVKPDKSILGNPPPGISMIRAKLAKNKKRS